MGKFEKLKTQREEKVVQKKNCAAHGCPLKGTNASCTQPDEYTKWYCRFHLGTPLKAFGEVTDVLNNRLSLLEYAHRIKVAPEYSVKGFVRQSKNPDFNKKDDENYQQFSVRLNAVVTDEVKTILDSHK